MASTSRFSEQFRQLQPTIDKLLHVLPKDKVDKVVFAYSHGAHLKAFYNHAGDDVSNLCIDHLTGINTAARLMEKDELWFRIHPKNGVEAFVEYLPGFRDEVLVDIEDPIITAKVQ